MPGFPAGVHLKGGRNAAPVHAEMAREFYEPIIPIVMELHRQGLSLRAIGRELDKRKVRPRLGYGPSVFLGYGPNGVLLWDRKYNPWSASQVRRVLIRGKQLAETESAAEKMGAFESAREGVSVAKK